MHGRKGCSDGGAAWWRSRASAVTLLWKTGCSSLVPRTALERGLTISKRNGTFSHNPGQLAASNRGKPRISRLATLRHNLLWCSAAQALHGSHHASVPAAGRVPGAALRLDRGGSSAGQGRRADDRHPRERHPCKVGVRRRRLRRWVCFASAAAVGLRSHPITAATGNRTSRQRQV